MDKELTLFRQCWYFLAGMKTSAVIGAGISGLAAAFVLSIVLRGYGDTTVAMVASSFVMFAACLSSALHLLGPRATWRFVLVAVVFGWFAEQMG